MVWWCSIFFIVGMQLVTCDVSLEIISDNDEDRGELLPGVYPTFRQIPKTEFSCLGKLSWNYYADVETECQVFHICETQYSKLSFLCPIGSIFNQRHLVCDWWYNVECQSSVELYPENNNLMNDGEQLFFEENDLNIASSGGNEDPLKNEPKKKELEIKKKDNPIIIRRN